MHIERMLLKDGFINNCKYLGCMSQNKTDVNQKLRGDSNTIGVTPCLLVDRHEKIIFDYLELMLQTGYLKGRNPLSTIFIAPPGIGKSRLLFRTKNLKYVSYNDDMTPKYIVKFLNEVDKGELRFLIIPDYNIMTSGHQEHTRATYQGILRQGMEGGISNLADYGLEFSSKSKSGLTKFGLITAITTESYNENMYYWRATGFLSRLIPFSFNHTEYTKDKIQNDIINKNLPIKLKFNINKKLYGIENSPDLLRQLKPYEEILSLKSHSLPYRQTLQLNTLVEASCSLRRGIKIEQKDVDKIIELCRYINYDMVEI